MLDSIKLGQYLHGDSWFYRLDPRGKLVITTLFIIVIFLANNLVSYLAVTIFALSIILTSGISLKYFYKSVKPIFFLILITFFLNLFLIKEGSPLFKIPIIRLYKDNVLYHEITLAIYVFIFILITIFRIRKKIEKNISGKIIKYLTLLIIVINILLMIFIKKGPLISANNLIVYSYALQNGSFLILRLILIISFSSLLTFTTKPTDLTLAIEKVLGPLKIFKLPISELALMISISLRFIPTLLEETQKILKAQTSRGADFTEGNIKDKVMQIVSLLIPMFIISFKRAEDLANAMEARGYVPGKARTSLKELKWKYKDTVFLFAFILLATFLIFSKYIINW